MIDLSFWLGVVLLLLVYHSVGPAGQAGWFAAASIIFLAWRDPVSLGVLGAMTCVAWAALKWRDRLARGRWAISAGLVVLLAGALAGYKLALSVAGASVLFPLGLSYFALRAIHVVVDTGRSGAVTPGFSTWVTYLLMFPTLPAGPIDRLDRIAAQLGAYHPWDVLDFKEGCKRILRGLALKFLLGAWLLPWTGPLTSNPYFYLMWERWLALPAYSLMILCDFAGYSDIAIGTARLFGIRVMENFRRPYLTGNISQFWREWHISLSEWLRDYIFLPTANRWIRWGGQAGVYGAAMLTMVLCGAWHGLTPGFLVWGLLHGLALAAHQAYRRAIRRHKPSRRFRRSASYRRLCIALTFAFVTAAWVPFAAPSLAHSVKYVGALFRW